MNEAHASPLEFHFRLPRFLFGLLVALSVALLTACGGDDSSSGSTVTAPSITTQPTSQSVTAGSAATFTVVASGGGTLTYQWYKGGSAVSGATSASYTIAAATTSDAGSYYVTVSSSAGSGTSNTVTLTVTAVGPTITTQPTSQTVAVGASVTFTVVATGSGTLTYQWYKGTTAISGATSASYTISSAATTDAGSYDVTVTDTAGSTTSSAVTLIVGSSTTACDSSYISGVMSAITTLDTALGSTLTADMTYSSTSYTTAELNVYKTDWSNLPPGAINFSRPGITLSQLTSSTQISAFNALAEAALSTAGYEDFQGVLAADDYLGYTQNASGYGAELYHVAVVGTPSASGTWSLMFGGHHTAFNLAFNGGCLYPTPHHIGVEPRTSFTSNNHYASTYGTGVYTSGTYQVIANKAAAMVAIFTSLDSSVLSSAFLTGQTFSDMLIGPVEANTGSYSAVTTKFEAIASSTDRGVLVSSLSSSQQALVTAAIEEFTNDYDSTTAANLLSAYESGYSSTYVAWANAAGTFSSSGPDITTSGTYMRIDGPRVWIELAIQSGIVIQGQTHYHMMFRDKTYDYYNQLAE